MQLNSGGLAAAIRADDAEDFTFLVDIEADTPLTACDAAEGCLVMSADIENGFHDAASP